MSAEVQESRRRVLNWLTGHKAFYGNSHSHEKVADAWEQMEVFDEAGSCITFKENEDGFIDAFDITDGLKMSNRTWRHAVDEQKP